MISSSRFQPGEGPSRGLLRDYELSDGTFSSTIVERHSGRGMACRVSRGEKGGTPAINVNWCLIIIRGDNEENISLAKIKTCFA